MTELRTASLLPDRRPDSDQPGWVAPPEGSPAATGGEAHHMGGIDVAPTIEIDHLIDHIPVGHPVGKKGKVENLTIHATMPSALPNRTPWLERQLSRLPGGIRKTVLASGHNIDPSVQTRGFMDALAEQGRIVF